MSCCRSDCWKRCATGGARKDLRTGCSPASVPTSPHHPPCPVEKACHEAYSRCGISKPITPHSFRHAFAVHMLENGTDVRTIQLLLGHRSLSTTANYLRIATTKVCSATSPLDLLPRPIDAKAFRPPEQS